MSFFRVKTVKGKQYLYKQTSVREGKRVHSIMEYWGALKGKDTFGPTRSRNQDLEATRNPKRADATVEHRKELFKNDKTAFDRLHEFDANRAKDAKAGRAKWNDRQASRSEKEARAEAKQAADAKFKEDMEAVKEFNDAHASAPAGKK